MTRTKKICFFFIPVFSLVLAGSATNPYLNRDVTFESGVTKTYLFAYGKYCGKGYPVDPENVDKKGKVKTLLDHWPPEDDIDALCYAHDACYEKSDYDEILCDRAFIDIIEHINKEYFLYKNPPCWLLTEEMGAVFYGKFLAKSKDKRSEFAHKVSSGLAISSSPFVLTLFAPVSIFVGYPEDSTTCMINKERFKPEVIVEAFETQYSKYSQSNTTTSHNNNAAFVKSARAS